VDAGAVTLATFEAVRPDAAGVGAAAKALPAELTRESATAEEQVLLKRCDLNAFTSALQMTWKMGVFHSF
jgi:hypothetical protein